MHLGHTALAEEAREELLLDHVLMMPAGMPVTRPGLPVTPAVHRLEMLKIAVKSKRYLKIDGMELERPGRTYTIDTIEELRKKAGAEDEIYFIMGSDSLPTLGGWKQPGRIIELCRIAVAPRPGYRQSGPEELEGILNGLSERIIFLKGPYVDVSASQVREAVSQGLSVESLVGEGVAGYIKEHKLYREALL